jgi:diguanylate cyclase (GGDEF)-like protein
VVHRLASQDYAVETPNFNQIDEIGDMAQAIRIFRENGLARQRLEKERDADWAIRELLARMTQRLQGCENFNDVINVAELFAPNIAPGIAGRLYVLDREPWQMRCVAQWLSPVGEETTFHPDECWAVRRGQSHPPVNGEPDIACYHLPASQAESALCVPLIAQGEAIGLLSFQNITADNAPSRAYLELMAEALGLALANQRLRDALLEKALFDPLTGLRNRHHLEDTLQTQTAQAMRTGVPLSCMMIDIDHFKSINDRFGHEAGDLVIKSVASIVQRAAHDNGLAFRYGGEFLVLLSGADEAEAHACAQKIYTVRAVASLRADRDWAGGRVDWHCQLPTTCPDRQPAARRGCGAIPGKRAGTRADCEFWDAGGGLAIIFTPLLYHLICYFIFITNGSIASALLHALRLRKRFRFWPG